MEFLATEGWEKAITDVDASSIPPVFLKRQALYRSEK
jgi:hypothetical protein